MGAKIDPQWFDRMGEAFAAECDRLWPGEDDAGRAACLVEEAAETQRAVTKRRHARRSPRGLCKGMTVDQWTSEQELELCQTVGVALDIAHREGFDLVAGIERVLQALQSREVDS